MFFYFFTTLPLGARDGPGKLVRGGADARRRNHMHDVANLARNLATITVCGEKTGGPVEFNVRRRAREVGGLRAGALWGGGGGPQR